MNIKFFINTLIAICLSIFSTLAIAETVIVEIKDDLFGKEQPLVIKAGTTVKWVNVEKRQYHSVWFEKEGFPPAEYIFPEETWERTFDEPGTYEYRCEPHEDMFGTIVVE